MSILKILIMDILRKIIRENKGFKTGNSKDDEDTYNLIMKDRKNY